MNLPPTPPMTPEFSGLALDLQSFCGLCEEVLALVTLESQSLLNQNYQPGEFNEKRKSLLPKLESALVKLGERRKSRRQAVQPEEIKTLFQSIESLLMKILLLDRENQQTLLRRGLVPTKNLPPVAAQRPHYVADLYQKYSSIRGGGPVV
jgi:hypothetical protein